MPQRLNQAHGCNPAGALNQAPITIEIYSVSSVGFGFCESPHCVNSEAAPANGPDVEARKPRPTKAVALAEQHVGHMVQAAGAKQAARARICDMERYYFHIRDGDVVTPDDEGAVFQDLDAARDGLMAGIRDIVADHLSHGTKIGGRKFEIADARGNVLDVIACGSLLR